MFKQKWARTALLVVITVIVMYIMIYVDVWFRAKHSYFEAEKATEKNDWKMAYVWYQTAVEQFSPPNSKWVKMSKEKMPLALEKWKEDLRKKKIPFEDYMLE
ncbi:MAG TPA: hypothetical protein DCP53_02240 [Elusimicrobia bacterium]|nr:hypothetical protein [Elusimicrobiota bacterium]